MDGYEKAQHQAAGHGGALVDQSGSLFVKPTTQQEIDFYTQAQKRLEQEQEEDDETYESSRLTDWMPVFMGTLQPGITEAAEETHQVTEDFKQMDRTQENDKTKKYVVIQNLLHGFKKPAIIDIKLGAVLHDDCTTEEKKQRLQKVSKDTTSGSLHYRVCGMKLHNSDVPDVSAFANTEGHVTTDNSGYLVFDKWYGRALTPENVVENFKIFFTHNRLTDEQQQIVIRNTYTRLQLLYNCLLSEEVRIRSASVLVAFENDLERWNEMNNDDPIFRDDLAYDDDSDDDDDDDDHEGAGLAPLSILSLIDFAHSKFTPGKGHDEDVVVGVENLIKALEKLVADE